MQTNKATIEHSNKNYYWKAYFSVIVLSILAYLIIVGGKSVWGDEAYTFAMLKHSFGDMCSITAADVHPPLYYILLKIFTYPFGYSLLSAKIFSIITYIAIIAFGGYHIRKIINERTAIMFMVLFLFYPFMLAYSLEVRMYSLAAMFVFMSAIYAYKVYSEDKKINIVLYALFTLCSAYTHYFALMAAGIVFLELLVFVIKNKREKLKQLIIATAVMAIGFIPWLGKLLGQLKEKSDNGFWIPPITRSTVIGYLKSVFGINVIPHYEWLCKTFFYVCCLMFLAAFIYAIIKLKNKNNALAILAILVPIFVMVIGIGVSVAYKPVFITRYIVPTIPLLLLFAAIVLGEINNKWISALVLAIVIIGGCFNYVHQYKIEYRDIKSMLTTERLQKHKADACVTDINGTFSAVIAYYDDKLPIYARQTQKEAANPYPHTYFIDKFDHKKYNRVLLLVPCKTQPSSMFTDYYKAEYVGTKYQQEEWADAYMLTKK